jgi:hypothetical protein
MPMYEALTLSEIFFWALLWGKAGLLVSYQECFFLPLPVTELNATVRIASQPSFLFYQGVIRCL